MAAARYDGAISSLGSSAFDRISTAKVLVVGAGGIGCELLKNLVMTGFRNIEVIDLDTIDVSNLNRQFLFRPEHVSMSKAEVAVQAVMRFNPDAKVVAHHSNVKNAEFGIEYFKQFDIVMNALDNVSARRHVNRVCLSAGIPLVESGTAGYIGQSYVIQKGVTRCFDCVPVADQKTYPICTIRSTPEKPVHCVVWAKELYKLLFGDPKSSMMYEENADESVYMKFLAPPLAGDEDAIAAYAKLWFKLMFHDEIKHKLEMKADTYKTAKFMPKPQDLDALLSSCESTADAVSVTHLPSQRQLSPTDSALLFLEAVKGFLREPKVSTLGACEFSKDDALDLDFITAASNLRALVFSIPLQSKFDIKSIAGNIIPAIATTNAIVAGLEVLQAVKLLQSGDAMASCRYVYCNRSPAGRVKALLMPVQLEAPLASCFVCGTSVVTCALDTETMLLTDFVEQVLKSKLGFNTPSISLANGSVIFEEAADEDDEDADFTAFLTQPLARAPAGGVHNGTQLMVVDFSQALSVNLVIVHRDESTFDEKKSSAKFEIVDGTLPVVSAAAPESTEEPTAASAASKRARPDTEEAFSVDADGCFVLDDEDGGEAAVKRSNTSPQ